MAPPGGRYGTTRGAMEGGTGKVPFSPQGPILSASPSRNKARVKTGRKAKKWAPLDLSAIGSRRKTFQAPVTGVKSTAASLSGAITTSTTLPPIISSAEAYRGDVDLVPPVENGKDLTDDIADFAVCPTPQILLSGVNKTLRDGQTVLDSIPPRLTFEVGLAPKFEIEVKPSEQSPLHIEHSQATKNKLVDIMARIDEAFDVEEWDPDLPIAGPNNSPEPLAIKPQPVTYTTVGSLVKTNSAPKFTAPIRIQREGAGRRPPFPPIQPRGSDNYYTRDHQGGNLTNSGYFPTIAARSSPRNGPQPKTPRSPHTLSDIEKEVLLQSLGVSTPAMSYGSCPPPRQQYASEGNPIFNGNATAPFVAHDLMKGDVAMPQGSLSGLDLKMQTLQRLAQYKNPNQEEAKKRLAGFAAAKMRQPDGTNFLPFTSQETKTLTEGSQPGKYLAMQVESDAEQQKKGHLNFGFRFPPYQNDHTNDYTTTSAAFSTTSYISSSNATSATQMRGSAFQHDSTKLQAQGYPQPLTAGPPGPRLNSTGTNWPQNSFLAPFAMSMHNSSQQLTQVTNVSQYSPWANNTGPFARPSQNAFSSVSKENHQIRDTLSLADRQKYYPNGLPSDMATISVSTGNISIWGKSTGRFDDEKQTKDDRPDKWWYSGVRRLDMSAEDHLIELESRELNIDCGYTPQPPIAPPQNIDREIFTVAEVQAKTTPECAAPLLDSLFGTLLGYADKVITPMNKAILSKFELAPQWLLDTGEDGNLSLYDQDREIATKTLEKNLRYKETKGGAEKGGGSPDH